ALPGRDDRTALSCRDVRSALDSGLLRRKGRESIKSTPGPFVALKAFRRRGQWQRSCQGGQKRAPGRRLAAAVMQTWNPRPSPHFAHKCRGKHGIRRAEQVAFLRWRAACFHLFRQEVSERAA